MLFENSIVCLVVFVCCFLSASFSRLGVDVFDASFGVVLLGQIFSDCEFTCLWMGCFCLESLILAQDER
ncbi:hypothetical protein, partial [Mycolicibacterium smegmatis]|uniref:hypothetical protein n=1 Tax=Mycolicibacterium smegmatis TaxID=1772 RepID=UPI001E348E69